MLVTGNLTEEIRDRIDFWARSEVLNLVYAGSSTAR
jgi:hypothetical protein